ncbi:hypothetical protein V1514DRAFT_262448, partial [Lipomyces japonicus]|uniref:uncharacterized protein n=1 Tax=Lipomyces japonicus TaxID=56871 RepID=UPI0034CD1091
MFRSATPSPIEEAVNKATDENLTAENWEYVLAVCDKVNDNLENGPRDVVAALQKRLTHRSANVQLYTLTLTDSLAQNCGTKLHRELASRAFTQVLIRVASDRSVHASVKARLLNVMEDLVELFKPDPSLSIMADALATVKADNPRLHAPDKPQKPAAVQRTQTSEDEELQMALALSLQESKQQEEDEQQRRKQEQGNEQKQQQQQDEHVAGPDSAINPTATISRVRALYDLTATEPGELSFRRGDVIFVLDSVYHDWWKGSLRGEVGIFPLNYVTPIPDPTADEIQQEIEDEKTVFAEAANIERLLALLSSPNSATAASADSEELQALYRSSIGVRPKLIKLIDKYSQRKEELIELNERFASALHKYNSLMESYVAQYRSQSSNSGHYQSP